MKREPTVMRRLTTPAGTEVGDILGGTTWGGQWQPCPLTRCTSMYRWWWEQGERGLDLAALYGLGQAYKRARGVYQKLRTPAQHRLTLGKLGLEVVDETAAEKFHEKWMWHLDPEFRDKMVRAAMQPSRIREQVEIACRNTVEQPHLGFYPDGQALHDPDEDPDVTLDRLLRAIDALDVLKREGKLRFVGLAVKTNPQANAELIYPALRRRGAKIDYVVASGHLALNITGQQNDALDNLVPICEGEHIALLPCSFLGGNALALSRQEFEALAAESPKKVNYQYRPATAAIIHRIRLFHEICTRHKENPKRVAWWVSSALVNASRIIGAATLAQLKQNVKLMGETPKAACLAELQLNNFIDPRVELAV